MGVIAESNAWGGNALAKGQMPILDILSDIRHEPAWRHVANREWAYADCNQFDSDLLQAMEAAGMLPVSRPLIPAALDIVLGMEARTRRDGVVMANQDKDSEVAQALSVRLKEVERLSGADVAISQAYQSQVFVGVGWVEVGKNPDPFDYRHQCTAPHRSEIYWDWRQGPRQRDWRYMVRRAWFDLDRLGHMFPRSKALTALAGRALPDWAMATLWGGNWTRDDAETLYRDGAFMDLERASGIETQEWLDTERARACLFEVWYRSYARAEILRLPAEAIGEDQEEDLVLELDRANPAHLALLDSGLGGIEIATVARVRLGYWVGPHLLADIASPYSHGAFPYVFFPGMREDRSGMYYGLIRRMMSTQDSVNADLTMARHLATSTMVIADDDAFANPDPQAVRQELANRRSLILLNSSRKNRGREPNIQTDRALSSQHYGMMQEAMRTLPELAGVYAALQGKQTSQQSGVAVAALVEQGTTGLAAMNANYAEARKQVLHQLLANEIQHMEGRRFQVAIERARKKVTVAFNAPAEDGRTLTNDLTRLATRVELADAPASATYKQQLLAQLMEMAKALPSEAQIVLIPAIIRGMDFPDREEIAQAFEQRMGIGESDDPATALNRQRQAALEQRQKQLALDATEAKTRLDSAKADKLQAELDELRLMIQGLVNRLHANSQDQQIQAALSGAAIPAPLPEPAQGMAQMAPALQ